MLVDVWKINLDESKEDYEPWLQEAYRKKWVGWMDEKGERGNLSGLLLQKHLDKFQPQPKSAFKSPITLPKIFSVVSYAPFPIVGGVGDYLIHGESLVGKYKIVTPRSFEKDYQIVSENR
jgi:hypothetical protein